MGVDFPFRKNTGSASRESSRTFSFCDLLGMSPIPSWKFEAIHVIIYLDDIQLEILSERRPLEEELSIDHHQAGCG
jgi:hypothetical protein